MVPHKPSNHWFCGVFLGYYFFESVYYGTAKSGIIMVLTLPITIYVEKGELL